MLLSTQKIKNAVFDLNKNGALGLDNFEAYFYQTYLGNIIQDVINVDLEFFFVQVRSFLTSMPNTLILIHKHANADIIEQYGPIVMAKCLVLSDFLMLQM